MHTGRNFGSFKGTRQPSGPAAQGLARSPGSPAQRPRATSDNSVREKSPAGKLVQSSTFPQSSPAFLIPAPTTHTEHTGFCSIELGAVTVSSVAPRGAPGPRAARSPSQEVRLHHSRVCTRTALNLSDTTASGQSRPPRPNAAPSRAPKHTREIRRNPRATPETAGREGQTDAKTADPARPGPAPIPAPRRTRTRAFSQSRKRIARSHGRARVSECRFFWFMPPARSSGPASTPSFGGRLVRLKSLNPLRPSRWELVPIACRGVAVRRSEPCRSVRDPGVCARFRYRSEAGTGPSLAAFGSCRHRWPCRSLSCSEPSRDSRLCPYPHPRRYCGPSGSGCRSFAPLQGGQRGNRDGGEEAGICGVRGHQKVWGQRAAGVETEVAAERGRSVGIAREGSRRMRKQRGKRRWTKGEKRNEDRDIHREHNT